MENKEYYSNFFKNIIRDRKNVKNYETNYQNTCYTACLERGDDYDDEIHRELGYQLEASKDIYISDLECFVLFFVVETILILILKIEFLWSGGLKMIKVFECLGVQTFEKDGKKELIYITVSLLMILKRIVPVLSAITCLLTRILRYQNRVKDLRLCIRLALTLRTSVIYRSWRRSA